MIEVEMNDDIRKTKAKVFGKFDLRQLICIILAASYSIPIAIYLPFDITLKIVLGVLLAVPVVMCGWIRLNKEPFEIVLIRYIYKHFLTPSWRKVKRNNSYKTSLKKIRKKEEKKRIKTMSPKQRKAYQEKQKKGKTVTYSNKAAYKIYR